MKNLWKKLVCLITVLVLVLSVTACSADPNCGTYRCKKVTVDGITVNAIGTGTEPGAFDKETKIELKTAGACDVTIDGNKYGASWKSDSNKITIFIQEAEWVGTLTGTSLSIEVTEINDSIKMIMDFEKE